MAIYSINDIEQLSGVKAHTIRMWEKRFDIIKAKRTVSNIRYFDDEDLQLILNIALLNRKGFKISKIARMNSEEIKLKVAESLDVESAFDDKLDVLMLAMFELNEYKFNKILDHQIKENGLENTLDNMIYPLLDKLSMMWLTGSVKSVHESFVSNIIKRKLIIETDKLTLSDIQNSTKTLIFLPENDTHELSLLYLHFLLKKHGAVTLNLGIQTPLIDVLEANEIFQPHYIFTIFNDSFEDKPLQPYLDDMAKYVKDCKIVISGYQTIRQKITLPPGMIHYPNLTDLKTFIFKEIAVNH